MTRKTFLLTMAGAATAAAQERSKMHNYERQSLQLDDFDATGYVLDIGGGGEGVIGRLKPSQVVAIDLYKRELEESPAGPLKIVMDATDLKFLDASFDTVTAFYSLMYMRAEIQKKVFAEAARVLKTGGRWLIWDAVIPAAVDSDTKGPVFYFEFKLPRETVRTGYGTFWPPQPMDVAWYQALASEAGLKVASAKEQPGAFRTFHMELRKA